MARISYISGPVVKARLEGERAELLELVHVGRIGLIGEVVELGKEEAVIQVYEETTGLRLDEPVAFSGEMLCAELGPGLLGSVYDGTQRPLYAIGDTIPRGLKVDTLDRSRPWRFVPLVKKGERVEAGSVIGEVLEGERFRHKVMVPEGMEGVVETIAEEGDYTVQERVATLEDGGAVTLMQRHPVRLSRSHRKRLSPTQPLVTGQRIIDFLFPIAKGGTASIPGGFGTGKTILQQTLAKWCDADIIVYIGCGERGNEMTEVLEEFPHLKDPRTGKKLSERTVLIANTSDMPVSARETSIFLGLSIAEYYRDMGYHVALMADSTSRWAEAMRELSGRMNELPVEEGFPAYLASRIAAVYERAGMVETLGGAVGSVSIIGAVSPPGGDMSEPVTRHTRRFTSAFWALDRELASARFYPAINYIQSYSAYAGNVKAWWDAIFSGAHELRVWMQELLQEDDKLQKIVKLLGSEAIPEEQKRLVEVAGFVKELFLQQNAFDDVDMYSSPERVVKIAKIIRTIDTHWRRCQERKQIPVAQLKSQPVILEFVRARYSVTNAELETFDAIEARIVQAYDALLSGYGE